MNLSSRLFTSIEDLAPYARLWDAVLSDAPGNSIFLTWEWLSTWCDVIGKDIPLFIIAVFDEDEGLQAIAPLYLSSFKLVSCIPYNCLRPIGDCHCGGEYPDILIASGVDADKVLEAVRKCLGEHKSRWDCIYIPYLSGWTGAMSRWGSVLEPNSIFFRKREVVFSSIHLPETTEEYDKYVPGSLSALIRRQRKKLGKCGSVSIQLCQDERELPVFLNSLFSLHKKRWESVGQQGSFIRRPLMQGFYQEFAQQAFQRGWLKIFTLRIDNVVLAVQIGYLYRGVFYQMQEGFDPDGPGGLGNVLRHAVIDWCIANKVTEYDYLGGDEEHKLKWGAQQRNGKHLFLGKQSVKNLLLATAEIWPSGKYISEGPPASYGRSHD